MTDRTLKLVICGDSFVGKTSLIFAYTKPDHFNEDYEPTIFNTYSSSVVLNHQRYNLNLFDSSGRSTQKLTQLRVLSYHQADVVLLCFSLIDPLSLDSCRRKWMPEIRTCAPKDCKVILVGIKEDLLCNSTPLDKRIDRKFAQAQSDQMGCVKFLTCSALTLRGVKRVFDESLLIAATGQTSDVKPQQTWNALCCALL
ncbi:hypothetical protein M3Y98_00151700 [Aphelenchoides besseyi]|nr:hypothetical protein M3Y98_00151700 [Aphelenchoides besseyi]KAI6199805.1 hypothetical protein M3Y96_00666000 [Aphelenchoides besseyi]